jgi:hypothetical protein
MTYQPEAMQKTASTATLVQLVKVQQEASVALNVSGTIPYLHILFHAVYAVQSLSSKRYYRLVTDGVLFEQ